MYRMPAEWERQEAIWLAWPHQKNDWPEKHEAAIWAWLELARQITRHQTLRVVAQDAAERKEVTKRMKQANVTLANVDWARSTTDRSWMRDSAPIFVADKKSKAALCWKFTGWAKYANHKLDQAFTPRAAKHVKAPMVQPTHKGKPVVLEGGAIDVNGKGTILTTEECLLDPKIQVRNPGFTREDYESLFAHYLGAPNTIWLGKGIAGDDTHGHIDDLARFVSPNTVVTVVAPRSDKENYAHLADNLKRLKKAPDQDGKKLNVVELPMPAPLYFDGVRLPASYANFLITNQQVLVPTFNDAQDRAVLDLFAKLFPKREIVGIHAVDLVWGFGTLHCLSQQEPKLR